MALPVVLKSGKNYITLILDKSIPFEELLSHIINKFIENERFFEGQSFAIMLEGRKLDDREKNIILDAIDEYAPVHITQLIENDIYHEYAVIKSSFDRLHPVGMDFDDDKKLREVVDNNCLYLGCTVHAGEKIFANNHIVIKGDVESGAIVKAGNSITVFGRLEGQAIAGVDENAVSPYIVADEFMPENFRIGSLLGTCKIKRSNIVGKKKGKKKMAQIIDGEIQIKKV